MKEEFNKALRNPMNKKALGTDSGVKRKI